MNNIQFYISHKLVEENSSDPKRRNEEDKLVYPFMLVKQGNNIIQVCYLLLFIEAEACFLIKQDETNKKACIFSDKQLHIISEDEIVKNLLMNE